MPPSIRNLPQIIEPQLLTCSEFEPFGCVVESPLPRDVNSIPKGSPIPESPFIRANQGSALKASNVSRWVNKYGQNTGRASGTPTISMFICFPRTLESRGDCQFPVFPVRILERHPFTSQSFIPMGLSLDDLSTSYLVIVAPSLPPMEDSPHREMPDLARLRAFVAHGRQAVTYGAGTWHAPMVVIGKTRVDFVVVQSINGVPEDDCQEVELEGEGLAVAVDLEHCAGWRQAKL